MFEKPRRAIRRTQFPPKNEEPTKQNEWKLKQYDTLMRYHAYEGQIYWARSQHFLVAHAVLFAFLATSQFPLGVASTLWIKFALIGLVCIVGLVLSVLWLQAMDAGEFWTARWQARLVALESDAYGDVELLRNAPMKKSAKMVAKWAAYLFACLWCVLTLLVIEAAAFKGLGYGFL